MSRIDDLIKHYCPVGVEFEPLASLGRRNKGTNITAGKMKMLHKDGAPIKVFAGGNTVASVNPDDIPAKNVITEPSIIVKSRGHIGFTYYDQSFTHKSELWSYTIPAGKANQRFIYYYLLTKVSELRTLAKSKSVKLPQLSVSDTDRLLVPVPPPAIQQEIVKILDKFTALEAELEAELEARRQQHTYYWNNLLTPGETWKTTTLGEVADVFDGPHATPTKTATGPWYLSISSLKDGRVDLAESAHLSEDQYPTWVRRVAPRAGDTLFSYETRLGQAAYWENDEPAALGRRMGLLRPRTDAVHPRFLTLLYLGPQFQKIVKAKTVSGSTVNRIPIANMASWEVIIPTLDKQAEIVEQVDAFDALVNDLKVGLPAELTARRKQYEYYRSKLLTFQELPA
jgi:type I restriction enzyme S subunit